MSLCQLMLLCAGFLTLDVIDYEQRFLHSAGGTAGNVAAMVSWLGSPSGVVARIGTDPAGAVVERDLDHLGVDMSMLVHDSGATTRIMHHVGPMGHRFSVRCVLCGRRLPRHRRLTAAHVDRICEDEHRFSALFIDRVSPALARLATRWADRGKTIVFEPWRRPAEPLLAQMLAAAHLVKVSGDRQLVEALEEYPRRRGGVDLVTLGAEGLRWRIDRGPWRPLRIRRTKTVDAAGAGDWLTAALLHTGDLGLDPRPAVLEERLAHGQTLAALSVAYPGALGLLRAIDRKDLDAVLRTDRSPDEAGETEPPVNPLPAGCCPACLLPD